MSRIEAKIVGKKNEVIFEHKSEKVENEGDLSINLRLLQKETNKVLTELIEKEKKNGSGNEEKDIQYFEDCSDDEDEEMPEKKSKLQ